MNNSILEQVPYSLDANGKVVQVMWLDGSANNVEDLWYGVRFTGSDPDGVRTGNMDMHKTLPIQSKFKGCTLSDNEEIKYLKTDDWTKYTDGSSVDFTTTNVMVELPDAYYTVVTHGDYDWEIRMSPYALEGYTKFDKQYVSAYEAYVVDNKMYSRKNIIPTVSKARSVFLDAARLDRNNNFAIYTYNIHKFITWCFVVEYATLNSQKAVNTELTAEGYHQGGLGNGCTTGTVNNAYAFIPTGTSDTLNSGSGEVTWTDDTNTKQCNRYRGIENPFGHVWKNVCDVIVTGADNQIYVADNKDNFGNDRALYKNTNMTMYTSSGYPKRLANNAGADLWCQELGGGTTTYFCDHYWTNPTESDRTLLLGAISSDGAAAGLFYLGSHDGVGAAYSAVGTRLVYIP